jgi:hypothetical protein
MLLPCTPPAPHAALRLRRGASRPSPRRVARLARAALEQTVPGRRVDMLWLVSSACSADVVCG